MSDLPERLLAIAESLVGDEWNHPLKAVDDCRNAAAELKRLTQRLREMELIYKVLPTLEATLCDCRWSNERGRPWNKEPTECERCTKLYAARAELTELQKGNP
jgi:hypothetical protein